LKKFKRTKVAFANSAKAPTLSSPGKKEQQQDAVLSIILLLGLCDHDVCVYSNGLCAKDFCIVLYTSTFTTLASSHGLCCPANIE